MRRSTMFVAFLATTAAFAAEARAQQCDPSRLMVVLDKSSSMQTGTINGVTKFEIAAGALETVVDEFEDSIELGLMAFPEPDQCSPGSVLVAPALGNSAAIKDELVAPPPSAGNWTPMAQTLEAAAEEPTLVDTTLDKYAVLITDGWQWCDPYDPSTRFAPVDAVADLNAAGVTTYVVGFGGAVDALALNSMAVEAGTALPGCDPTGDTPTSPNPCYYQADDPAQLVAALMEIAVVVSTETCDGVDNDCDGEVDEDLARMCESACGTGQEVCEAGDWVGCDAPPVEDEVCDGLDNDCDGTVDPGCDCAVGDSRACGGDETTGVCRSGTQTCAPDGTWGECEGDIGPGSEMCNGLDDDCDGETDESSDDVGSLCGPGFECVNGGCEELPPEDPPGDDDPMADGEGQPATCACATGSDRGTLAGSALLLLGVALVLRRRRA